MPHHAPVAEEPVPAFSAVLRDALEEKGVSVRELARRVAETSGTKLESERRLLMRRLKGDGVPEPPKARAYARALGMDDEEVFVTAAVGQASITELLSAINAKLERDEPGRQEARRLLRAVEKTERTILQLLQRQTNLLEAIEAAMSRSADGGKRRSGQSK